MSDEEFKQLVIGTLNRIQQQLDEIKLIVAPNPNLSYGEDIDIDGFEEIDE